MPDLDHRTMVPPILRICLKRSFESGDTVFHWHLRIAQPNVAPIPSEVIHSLEHFLLDHLLGTTRTIVSVGVMGCRTGLYIIALGIDDYETMADLVAGALEPIATATEVPHANPINCGWAEHHSLVGAQRVAAWLLDHRKEWPNPGPNARELEEL